MAKINHFVFCLTLGMVTSVFGQSSRDALAPKSKTDDALTKQLFGATICTTSLEATRLFYEKGMGLSLRGPVAMSTKTKAIERKMYDIPTDIDWQLYFLERPTVPSAIKIRLMVLNKPTPTIHNSWNSLEYGPFSLGFPNTKQPLVDSLIRKIGFGAQANTMNVYPVASADNSKYTVYETIFNGPDFVKGVGITRGDGMPQLSPTDATTGMGGPGYSAMILKNAQQFIDFMVNTLGMELRADRVWETSGALGVPAGTKYRFALVYAKGATSGHQLLLEFLNAEGIDTGVAMKIPNRGLGCWTFPCKDLDAVWANAKAQHINIIQPPTIYESLFYGKHKSMTMLAPNGFLIELFQE
jgi:catechol 2,3-dioxygenase-like lactoylglutathione lyase family enzyme